LLKYNWTVLQIGYSIERTGTVRNDLLKYVRRHVWQRVYVLVADIVQRWGKDKIIQPTLLCVMRFTMGFLCLASALPCMVQMCIPTMSLLDIILQC